MSKNESTSGHPQSFRSRPSTKISESAGARPLSRFLRRDGLSQTRSPFGRSRRKGPSQPFQLTQPWSRIPKVRSTKIRPAT